MRGARQDVLSRFFCFAPSCIGAGDLEGEGVGDGERDMDGEGAGMELYRVGALCPGALKTEGSGMTFSRRSSRSILSFSRRSLSHYNVEWWISSLPSWPFRVSSTHSFQSLFPNL